MIKSRLASLKHLSYSMLISLALTPLHLSTFVLNSLQVAVETFSKHVWVHFSEEPSQSKEALSLQFELM